MPKTYKSIQAKIEIRFMKAIRQWKSTHSNRDKELLELTKEILTEDFGFTHQMITDLHIKSLTF